MEKSVVNFKGFVRCEGCKCDICLSSFFLQSEENERLDLNEGEALNLQGSCPVCFKPKEFKLFVESKRTKITHFINMREAKNE